MGFHRSSASLTNVLSKTFVVIRIAAESHLSVRVDCFALAARGLANQRRKGATVWGEVQRTVECLLGRVMDRAFDSKSFTPGSHPSSTRWICTADGSTKDETTVRCSHGFLKVG